MSDEFDSPDLRLLLTETFRGKSLMRTLQNQYFRDVRLTGRGVDLASRDGQASYYRFLDTSDAEIIFTDVEPQPGVIPVNLEEPLPWRQGEFDFAIIGNSLNLVVRWREALSEVRRILRPGGRFLAPVPFLSPLADEPVDFHRQTAASLRSALQQAGFSQIRVTPVGCGPFTSAAYLSGVAVPRQLRFLYYATALGLDGIVRMSARGREVAAQYPIQYIMDCVA